MHGIRRQASGLKTRAVRSEIHTRKRTEEGLQPDFNSLHAQRESAEAYIASQRHEGWVRVAGIPKRDDRGRVLDIHALRHTFRTHLSKGGVAPRVAQAAMRHSKLELTMHTYTDSRLLDVAGALDALPTLPPIDRPDAQRARATGADGRSFLVPTLVPDSGKACTSGSQAGTSGDERHSGGTRGSVAADTACASASHPVSKPPAGLEPATCGLQSAISKRLRPYLTLPTRVADCRAFASLDGVSRLCTTQRDQNRA